jgi:hypothetical protein
MWHCHIVEHEDNDMMRPMLVQANPSRKLLKSAQITADNVSIPSVEGFALEQNSPNPFSTETVIMFKIPYDTHVQLKLFSIMGVEVKTLINADTPAGIHNIWLSSENLSAGTYVYQIKAGDFVSTKKLVIIK